MASNGAVIGLLTFITIFIILLILVLLVAVYLWHRQREIKKQNDKLLEMHDRSDSDRSASTSGHSSPKSRMGTEEERQPLTPKPKAPMTPKAPKSPKESSSSTEESDIKIDVSGSDDDDSSSRDSEDSE